MNSKSYEQITVGKNVIGEKRKNAIRKFRSCNKFLR